jgi:hypothetical protein
MPDISVSVVLLQMQIGCLSSLLRLFRFHERACNAALSQCGVLLVQLWMDAKRPQD